MAFITALFVQVRYWTMSTFYVCAVLSKFSLFTLNSCQNPNLTSTQRLGFTFFEASDFLDQTSFDQKFQIFVPECFVLDFWP